MSIFDIFRRKKVVEGEFKMPPNSQPLTEKEMEEIGSQNISTSRGKVSQIVSEKVTKFGPENVNEK